MRLPTPGRSSRWVVRCGQPTRDRAHPTSVQRLGSTVVTVLVLVLPAVGLAGCGRASVEPERSAATAGPRPTPTPTPEPDAGPVALEDFPLDRGWDETYGPAAVVGPDSGAGGISMPEGHCDEGVLFESGYRDKLSTYVTDESASRTREILRYASAGAARQAFRSLSEAVAGCPTFDDAYSGRTSYSAEAYAPIDEANGRSGFRTLTFAYTSNGSPPFGVLYQFALVDDLLYGSNVYGRWTRTSARDGVAAVDHDNDALVPLLSQVDG